MDSARGGEWSRRQFLTSGGKLSLAALGGLATSAGAVTPQRSALSAESGALARGRVFHDRNGSGRSIGQKGVPGVLVSNGLDIVATDSDGRYALPMGAEGHVHVIKPRGYQVALNAEKLPQFHYLHRPEGSPDVKALFPGIAATGPLPDNIDFPLYPQSESGQFSVLLTSDPQPLDLQQLQWYAQTAIPEFRRHAVAFGISCGDLVWGLLDLYQPYNAVNALCGFPWYNLKGNHDLNTTAEDDRYAAETFQRVFGPTTYAFQYAKVHFIVLDNVYWEGFAGLQEDGWPQRSQYRGHIRARDLQYVANYLRHVDRSERIVVCAHIPLFNPRDPGGRNDTPEMRQLLELLSPFRYTQSFSGHVHINRNDYLGPGHGYEAPGGARHHHCNLTATSGSFYGGPQSEAGVPFAPGRDGSPKGYALVHFSGAEDYRIEVLPLDFGGHPQYACDLPNVVKRADLAQTAAQINVFAGSERTQVWVQLDSGPWQTLEPTPGLDRRYVRLRERSRTQGETGGGALLPPLATPHLWHFPLPVTLSPGWHGLNIRIVADFGDLIEASHPFWVVAEASEIEPLQHSIRVPRTGAGGTTAE